MPFVRFLDLGAGRRYQQLSIVTPRPVKDEELSVLRPLGRKLVTRSKRPSLTKQVL